MNNILTKNINLNMNKSKDKNEIFKELIIKYLIKQITETN